MSLTRIRTARARPNRAVEISSGRVHRGRIHTRARTSRSRQHRRQRSLETEEVAGLRVPTLAEMARIKAWLLATRNTTRDYLDSVVLFERLGADGVAAALGSFDEIYRQPGGSSPLAEVAERLVAATPSDGARIDLRDYRGLRAPWNDWAHVVARGREWAKIVAELDLAGGDR